MIACLLLAGLLPLAEPAPIPFSVPANAPQESHSPYSALANIPHTVMEYEHATGDWFGVRDSLEAYGIHLSVTYTSDIAGNPVGGRSPGNFTYTDNFAFACLIKTEKLFGWHGGYFMISTLQRDGTSLSRDYIGNQFTVQQVYGGQTFHWYQLSYQQDFWDDRMSIKVGRIGVGEDFAVSPLYWLYMNNGIDGTPQAIPVNGRTSIYPNATWGSYCKIKLPSETLLRLGVYQAVPKFGVHGLNWDFYPSDGVMLLSQYEWTPEFFNPLAQSDVPQSKPPKGFQGHYWMGGYYSTMEYKQFNSTLKMPNAYGFYWHADQTLYKPDLQSDQGLVLWTAYVLSPQQNIALLPLQVSGGAIYTGLLPGRKQDFTILGATYGNFSTNYAEAEEAAGNTYRTYELVYEAGYRINLTKFAYFQPDLQWVINPRGNKNIPNALVIGAQTGIIF